MGFLLLLGNNVASLPNRSYAKSNTLMIDITTLKRRDHITSEYHINSEKQIVKQTMQDLTNIFILKALVVILFQIHSFKYIYD